MRTIIAGSRSLSDLTPVIQAINASGWDKEISVIISGGAKGVDRSGEYLGKAVLNVAVEVYPADWDNLDAPGAVIKVQNGRKYNARAGHDRNLKMAVIADALIAIWDGKSPGTKDMIDIATQKGLKVYVHKV